MFFPLPRGPLRWNGLRLFKKIEAAKEQVKEPILVWILGPYMHDGLMSYTRRMLNGKPLKDGRTSYTGGPVQARTLMLSLSIRHILDWCVTKSIVYRGPIIWIQICLGYSRKQLRLERRPWMPAQCRTRKRRNQINQRQRQRPRPKAREGKPVIARPKANDLGQRCRQTMKKGRKKRRKKLMMKRKKLMRHPPKKKGKKHSKNSTAKARSSSKAASKATKSKKSSGKWVIHALGCISETIDAGKHVDAHVLIHILRWIMSFDQFWSVRVPTVGGEANLAVTSLHTMTIGIAPLPAWQLLSVASGERKNSTVGLFSFKSQIKGFMAAI